MMAIGEQLGILTSIQRFPVKSMGSDPLDAAEVGWNGIEGDRRYTFVRSSNRGSFPYLTAREVPCLLLYRARYLTPQDPGKSAVAVTSPAGREYDIEDPALCTELAGLAGEPVHLMQLGRGHYDTSTISIISTTTAVRLAHEHGAEVGLRRFRINCVVEPDDSKSWDRDWLGLSIAIGTNSARLRVDTPIERCAMITLDPQSAERDVTIMRTVARNFENQIGMHCAIEQPGVIRPGDIFTIQR
jgi:uncharacterized protein